MARPVTPKKDHEHLLVLSRMLQSVEVDALVEAPRKERIRGKIHGLMDEFRSERAGVVPPTAVAS